MTSERSSVTPGGAASFFAYVLVGGASDLEVTVREGTPGGSIVNTGEPSDANLTYTAPSKPGTYHLDATFTGLAGTADAGKNHKASATITVVAAH